MDWYHYIAWAAIFGQLLFVYYAVRNYRFVLAARRRDTSVPNSPHTVLIVPCKGLDTRFDANIASFFEQNYDNFRLFFVVESEADPAYARLLAIRKQRAPGSQTHDVQILVAGPSTSCSQKIHNLLYAIGQLGDETEILAFADSDVSPPPDWLRRLIRPLRHAKIGLSTGYRWFIPTRNNLATLALSALNAAVAQLLGNSRFTQAWGGSMAVRAADFRRLGLPETWKSTLSDDLSLSQAVKKAGMTVTFIPGCLAASHEAMTWPQLCEFARRQFLITRIYAPATWALGFLSSLGSVLGLWGSIALATCAHATGSGHPLLYTTVAGLFIVGQLARIILRQAMIARVFPEHRAHLKPAMLADLLGSWLWSPLLLMLMIASAFGRTIQWRGTRYRLVSPTQTEVLGS